MLQTFAMLYKSAILGKSSPIDPAQSNKISASNPNIHSSTNALHCGKEREGEGRGWDTLFYN